jgi:hypothetical protein
MFLPMHGKNDSFLPIRPGSPGSPGQRSWQLREIDSESRTWTVSCHGDMVTVLAAATRPGASCAVFNAAVPAGPCSSWGLSTMIKPLNLNCLGISDRLAGTRAIHARMIVLGSSSRAVIRRSLSHGTGLQRPGITRRHLLIKFDQILSVVHDFGRTAEFFFGKLNH